MSWSRSLAALGCYAIIALDEAARYPWAYTAHDRQPVRQLLGPARPGRPPSTDRVAYRLVAQRNQAVRAWAQLAPALDWVPSLINESTPAGLG